MKQYFFTLNLSYQACSHFYKPGINSVLLRADSGQKVQLPTSNLRRFIQRSGIQGRFRLVVDEHNKVKSLDKIS